MGCGNSVPPPKPNNATVIADLFCLAPQFKTTDEEVLACYNTILNLLWCEINWPVVACCGKLIIVYLLAHTLEIRRNPGVGVVNSLKEGDLSIGYAIAAGGDVLNSTTYGQAYRDLIKRKVIGVTVSNLPCNFQVWNGPYGCC